MPTRNGFQLHKICWVCLVATQFVVPPTVGVAKAQITRQSGADAPANSPAQSADIRPVTEDELEVARTSLARNARQLGTYLDTGGANGDAWKRYLLWPNLESVVAADTEVDLAKTRDVLQRFRANHPGLELSWFSETASSLEHFIGLATVHRLEDQSSTLEQLVSRLRDEVTEYEQTPDSSLANRIGRRLGILAGADRAPTLRARIRGRLTEPNLYVNVSSRLIGTAVSQPIQESRPVTDVILGTHVRGTATTHGSLTAMPAMSPGGNLELAFTGTIHASTVGSNGPVCIDSTSRTQFCLRKKLLLGPLGFTALPSSASANTATDIHNIRPKKNGVGSGLIRKVAWKRATRTKPQAERIASDHARSRLVQNFDARVEAQLADARKRYNDRFRLPLVRRNEFPEEVDFTSQGDLLRLAVLKANASQIAVSTPPPRVEVDADFLLQVHESFPNNFAQALLANFRLTDDGLRDRVLRFADELPPELAASAEKEPWSLTFAAQQPVTVEFQQNELRLTIRGARFTSGEKSYGAMDITTAYQMEVNDQGMLLTRVGDLEIFPPGFRKGTDRLSASQTALQEILTDRLSELFEEQVQTEGPPLEGGLQNLKGLRPTAVMVADGWLTIGWGLPDPPDVVAAR